MSSQILSDEAYFHLDVFVNRQNYNIWCPKTTWDWWKTNAFKTYGLEALLNPTSSKMKLFNHWLLLAYDIASWYIFYLYLNCMILMCMKCLFNKTIIHTIQLVEQFHFCKRNFLFIYSSISTIRIGALDRSFLQVLKYYFLQNTNFSHKMEFIFI